MKTMITFSMSTTGSAQIQISSCASPFSSIPCGALCSYMTMLMFLIPQVFDFGCSRPRNIRAGGEMPKHENARDRCGESGKK